MTTTQDYSQLITEIYDADAWYKTYDYAKNAKRIMELLGDVNRESLLELGSGTGSYMQPFSDYYENVEGLELSPYMHDISLKKYPQFPVHLENMESFHINQSFDAIILLYGSIVELSKKTEIESLEAIRNLIRCCRNHIKPKGVVVIETYEQPDTIKEWMQVQQYTFEDKYVSHHRVKTVTGTNSATLTEHFLVSPKDPSGKTEYIKEVYFRYLCTADKFISLFEEQGFKLKTHVPSFALEGRDLLIFE